MDVKNQPRFKKISLNQDVTSAPKVKVEGVSGSQGVRPTCATWGKKHLEKFLADIRGLFGCGNDGHKVMDSPTISSRGRDPKQVPQSIPDNCAPMRNLLYVLQAKGENFADDAGK